MKIIRKSSIKSDKVVEEKSPIRRRSSFPKDLNFEGWWALSPKGRIAQLSHVGKNRREENTYHLVHIATKDTPQIIGNGIYTVAELLDAAFSFHSSKEKAMADTPRPNVLYELRMQELMEEGIPEEQEIPDRIPRKIHRAPPVQEPEEELKPETQIETPKRRIICRIPKS